MEKLPVGFYKQRGTNLVSCRVEVPNANLDSIQLDAIAQILKDNTRDQIYRKAFAHNSTRQNIILINLVPGSIDQVTKALADVGLRPGSAGPVVRNITSCLGNYQCPSALVDTLDLSQKLLKEYSGRKLRSKLKISIGGCPNACVNPYTDDISIHGVAYPSVSEEECERYQDGRCGKGEKTLCTVVCQEYAITIQEGKPIIDYDKCTRDGDCVTRCPEGTFINTNHGYVIHMGGRQGRKPRLAAEVVNWIPVGKEEDIVKLVGAAIDMFNENQGKRLCHVIDNIGGLDHFREQLSDRAGFTPYEPFRESRKIKQVVNVVLDESAADNGNKRTQDEWFDCWNEVKDGRVMASMGDFYLGFKEIKRIHEEGTEKEKTKALRLLAGLRDDFGCLGQDNLLVSSTRTVYSPNDLDSRIANHYRCSQPGLSKETDLTIPVYWGVSIADVVGDSQGLNYLQNLFDTRDDAETIIRTLEFVSDKDRGRIKVWTPPLNSSPHYTRSQRPDRAAGFDYDNGGFQVDGDILSGRGCSRGVLVNPR